MAEQKRFAQHWPVVVLIALVAVIFLLAIVAYTVQERESALVIRFGRPLLARDTHPGLHASWPYPVERIWRQDNRLHVFTGDKGELEEVLTSDQRNIVVTVFVVWKVPDINDKERLAKYMEQIKTQAEAEAKLTSLLRAAKSGAFSKHAFSDIITPL